LIEPKAVIFDYGNVLCLPQQASDVDRMSELIGIARPQFDELYWRFRDPYDQGEIDAAVYWNRIADAARVPMRYGLTEQLVVADSNSWMHPCQPMIDWAAVLKDKGIKVGLLSNMHFDLRHHLGQHCEWLRSFDHVTFSCDVGAIKPQEAIYRHCLAGLGVHPHESLFLDDKHSNAEGARRVGIHCIVFENPQQASREVAQKFRLPELRG
jgi:putative hydrolase of the HAD superfamily